MGAGGREQKVPIVLQSSNGLPLSLCLGSLESSNVCDSSLKGLIFRYVHMWYYPEGNQSQGNERPDAVTALLTHVTRKPPNMKHRTILSSQYPPNGLRNANIGTEAPKQQP